jgi:uncharacterized protein (DUF433 family)
MSASNMATIAQNRLKKLDDYILVDTDRLGGEPVFKGTRVPVRTLFVYLRKGIALEQFLDHFEGVTRQQAEAVLELAESGLLDQIQHS